MKFIQTYSYLFTLCFFLLLNGKSFSQGGELDPTFGNNGIVAKPVSFMDVDNIANAAAIQIDGKIVTAGYVSAGWGDSHFALTRYNPDGSLDNSFGIKGVVITLVGFSQYSISKTNAIAIQNDGKIVAGGKSDNAFAFARYNSDGTLDNSFGVYGGFVILSGLSGTANSIAIQTDGKIVAGGFVNNGNNIDFAVVRLSPDGNLDDTFGTNGIVITEIGTGQDEIRSIAIQADGKIIAAGTSYSSFNNFALVRYNTDGSLDNTFGVNGIVTTLIGTYAGAHSTALQNDGKIVTGGYAYIDANFDFVIARFNSDGSLDDTFGTNGIVTTSVGSSDDVVKSIKIQNDGKIIAAGYTYFSSIGNYFAIARYNPDGSLDNSFGNSGIITTDIGSGNQAANVIVIQNDSKLIAVGYSGYNSRDFALVRYTPNGALDNTFGNNGIVITKIGPSIEQAYSVAIQNDGKIVVAGTSYLYSGPPSNPFFTIARYNPDGSFDNNFGTSGVVFTYELVGQALSVAIQDDGKIVAAGHHYSSFNDFALVRYNTDGSLDNTFGNNGIVFTSIDYSSYAYSVTIQSDGKIVVAGGAYNNIMGYRFAIVRYNTDGSLDNTFGNNGIIITEIEGGGYAFSLKIQTDGKLVAVGWSGWANFTIARYNTDGSLDNTFGINGIVTTSIGSYAQAHSLAIQEDSKLIVAGNAIFGSTLKPVLARYNTDGSLDNSFGVDGIAEGDVSIDNNPLISVLIQNNGKIVLACSPGNPSNRYFALIRFLPDGSIDNTFGLNGIVNTQIGSHSEVNSLVIQQDGKLIAAGIAKLSEFHTAFTLVRYNPEAFNLSVNILNGWNLVSVPGYHPLNQNVNTWWAGKDPAAGVFKFSGGYIPVTTVAPTIGYWMKHLGANTYNTGEEWPAILFANHNPIPASAGWNLIGGYEYNVPTSGITTNPPDLIQGPVYGYSGGYQATNELVPGYGYWIKLSGSGEIVLPSPVFKGVSIPSFHINTDWGRIIITDKTQRSYILYAVPDATNLNEYELPPLPPAGVFDVRYGSGRYAEDIFSTLQHIEMNGVEFPIKVKVENVAITIKDETGEIVNKTLNVGEEYTIKQNINKLKVSGVMGPINYSLSQNYPNPFNPTTTIKFSIAKEGQVNLSVYNILGERVLVLKNEMMKPGYYQEEFDASAFASGVYIYRITAGDFAESKKMLLIK